MLTDSAAVLWARSILRNHRRSTLFLALFIGLVGAVVMTSAEVARRTSEAYDRFVAYSDPPDAEFTLCAGDDPGGDCRSDQVIRDSIAFIDKVLGPGRAVDFSIPILAFDDPTAEFGRSETLGYMALDPTGLPAAGRPIIVAGRLADPAAKDEIVVNEWFAQRHHLNAGSSLTVRAYGTEQIDDANPALAPTGAPQPATVVGIVRDPDDLRSLPGNGGVESIFETNNGRVYLGAGWRSLTDPKVASYGRNVLVNLPRGAQDLKQLQEAADAAFPDRLHQVALPDWADFGTAIRQVISLEARSVWIVGLIALLAGSFFAGQTLLRQMHRELGDHGTLCALGLPRRSILWVGTIRAVPVALGAAAVSIVVTALASPIGPIGSARRGELNPGIRLDWPVLVLGAVAVTVAALLGTTAAAVWATRERSRRVARGTSLFANRLSLTGRAGMSLGKARADGRSSVRAALGGLVLGFIAAVVAATLIASLATFLAHPARFGAPWDARVGNATSPAVIDQIRATAVAEPMVSGVMSMSDADVIIGGQLVNATALVSSKGGLGPPDPITGRLPVTDNEVALGPVTLRKLHLRVGYEIMRISKCRTNFSVLALHRNGDSLIPLLSLSAGKISLKVERYSCTVRSQPKLRRILGPSNQAGMSMCRITRRGPSFIWEAGRESFKRRSRMSPSFAWCIESAASVVSFRSFASEIFPSGSR